MKTLTHPGKIWADFGILLALCAAILCGCSTMTPPQVKDRQAAYDSTTPTQYDPFNNGFLFYASQDGRRVAIITPAARDDYNTLIQKYRVRYRDRWGVELEKDKGVTPFTDEHGNALWAIQKDYFRDFKWMRQMRRNNEPGDNLASKAIDTLR
jgi:hypothetical protein